MNIKKIILNASFALFAFFSLLSGANIASAGTIELKGSAWSGNIGWISFNCATTNTCSTSNYKVTWEDTTGYFSGYAWSDNIGWIKFDPTLSSCPNATNGSIVTSPSCKPRMTYVSTTPNGNTYAIAGFARTVSTSSNWSGYIDLTGMTLGFPTPINSGADRPFSGYIWGSDVLGWIDMTGVFMASFNPSVSVILTSDNYNSVEYTQPSSNPKNYVNLSVVAKNATSCTRTKTVKGVVQNVPNTGWYGTMAIGQSEWKVSQSDYVGPDSATYTVTCSNPATANKTATATIVVTPTSVTAPEVTLSVDKDTVLFIKNMTGVPNQNSVNVVNLTWSAKNATSCSGSKKVDGVVLPNEGTGTLSNYQWSGSLWSGAVSDQSKTHTVYAGGKDKNEATFPAFPSVVDYSVTCINSITGKYKTATVSVDVVDAVGDLVSSKSLVDYPGNNSTNLALRVLSERKLSTSNISNFSGTYPQNVQSINGNTNNGEFAFRVNRNYYQPEQIKSVSLFLSSVVGSGNFYLAIKSDNNGTPGNVLAVMKNTSPLYNYVDSTTTWKWVKAELETPINIPASKSFWVVLRVPPNKTLKLGTRSTTAYEADVLKYSSSINNPSYSNFLAPYMFRTLHSVEYTSLPYVDSIACNGSKFVNNIQTLDSVWGKLHDVFDSVASSALYPSYSIGNISKNVNVGPTSSSYRANCYNKYLPSESVIVESNVNVLNSVVTLPSIISFIANPSTFPGASGTTTLSWKAENATSCNLNKISPAYSNVGSGLPIESSEQDTVSANSTYQLSCTDGYNIVSKNVDVLTNVPNTPPPTVTLYATINPVTEGYRDTRLYWTASANATSCKLTRASDGAQLYPTLPATYGSVTSNNASNGILTSVPGTEDTYIVECIDSYSRSGQNSKNIKVAPPIPAVVGFGVGSVGTLSSTAVTGSTKTLVWNVSGVSSCTASSNPGTAWKSGNITGSDTANVVVRSTAGNQQYSLSCLNLYGIAVPTVTVNIDVNIPGPVIDRFQAFPPVIANNTINSIGLEWESSHTDSCALSRISPDSVSYGNNLSHDGNLSNIVISLNGVAGVATDVYRVDCVQTAKAENNNRTRHDSRDLSVQVDTLTKKIKVIER